jgi:outer membrane autotransporter protein
VKFHAITSRRTRLGARWDVAVSDTTTAYSGLSWEREYDGKARASIHGYALDTPKLTGNSAIVELGLTVKPTPNHPLTLDIGVQGYGGKREGVTGSLRVNYAFR